MENKSILVIEDNDRLRRFMASNLGKTGYQVYEAESGKSAYNILKSSFIDLVLLDLQLGDINGIEILQTIRRQDENLPVIIVSSVNNQDTKINSFDIGCDDYIIKPFYVDELLGRVKRMLKRTRPGILPQKPVADRITSGPFELNINNLSVAKNGKILILRKKLFNLLLFFIRHPETVLSNEQLFDRAWDAQEDMNENSIYVHIRELRKLIEDNPAKPRFIKTVRSAGYIYSADL